MLESFATIFCSTDKDSVGASGGTESKLIEGQSLATSVQNPFLCRASEAQSGNSQLGKFKQTLVVRNSGYGHDDFAFTAGTTFDFLSDAGEGDRRAVDFGKVKTSKDDLRQKRDQIVLLG
jgi:hypothetical protein